MLSLLKHVPPSLVGVNPSSLMVTVLIVLLLHYWCNHSFKLSDLNYMKIKLYVCEARSMLWIWGRFNTSMDEEYVCMLKLILQDLGA